jgi:hypothetical protein
MAEWKWPLSLFRRSPAEDEGQRLLRRRLETHDSYWWILAGGVYVPGFEPGQAAVTRAELSGLDLGTS